jgi:hypothetical protein
MDIDVPIYANVTVGNKRPAQVARGSTINRKSWECCRLGSAGKITSIIVGRRYVARGATKISSSLRGINEVYGGSARGSVLVYVTIQYVTYLSF